ncbi:MAG TPA: ShlB/FhaC/HecB family hemolysin secretion/activation protein [Gemmatimonadaceae bacterium]|jgi:hypothetical protein
MLFLLGAAMALNIQAQTPSQARRRTPIVRDSSADTVVERGRGGHRGVRRPVTADDQRTAFKDATARSTLLRARVARLSQDSALVAYDAMSYSRISAGMSLTKVLRPHTIFLHESAARVQWRQGVGAWIDMRGNRTVVPIAPSEAHDDVQHEANDPDLDASIPYYPGYEPLWVGSDIARAQVDENDIVNPIADGAEAYYTYQTGDSLSFTLPDKTVIRIRELDVRPRTPQWNLVVGSLWFDTKSGQLVRAAYRLSIPMDIWAVAKADDPKSMDDVPKWVTPMITPMKAEVTAIAVEYGLHEGRFWLPRIREAEGSAQVSFMHVPFKMEESFTYASVNAKDSLPPIIVGTNVGRQMPDSLTPAQAQAWRDSVRAVARATAQARRDSVRKGLREPDIEKSQCDTSETEVTTSSRFGSALKIATRSPCDLSKLENSPDLPPSIYDPADELFGAKELAELKSEALSLGVQAPFSLRPSTLPPPSISYGLPLMRYNRVEGLSFGASVDQQLGGGYSGTAVGRIGVADLEPNVDLMLTRTNLSDSIHVTAYNHLVSASDWGRPLSFSSSFSALLFGRDEGFYYRASGAELGGGHAASFGGGTQIDWRAFVEQERTAKVETNFVINGADFPANVVADRGLYSGVGAQITHDYGMDPQGLRVLTDLRLEAAKGDSAYGRAALDVTMSHGLGALAGSITLAGGSSVGGLPPQRRWFLGGSQTVRGQSPDTTQSGNAFWLTRTELGSNDASMRPTIFADIGWVGDRSHLSDVGRPMSGVGAGVSFLDGMFRFDVARGLYPRKQFRVDLMLEAKF